MRATRTHRRPARRSMTTRVRVESLTTMRRLATETRGLDVFGAAGARVAVGENAGAGVGEEPASAPEDEAGDDDGSGDGPAFCRPSGALGIGLGTRPGVPLRSTPGYRRPPLRG